MALFTVWPANRVITQVVPQSEAMLVAVKDMYSQGSQQGQAIRNIILDPGNDTAFKNLKKAGEEFQAASRHLEETTRLLGEKGLAAKMQEIAGLEAEDLKVLQEISGVVKAGQGGTDDKPAFTGDIQVVKAVEVTEQGFSG